MTHDLPANCVEVPPVCEVCGYSSTLISMWNHTSLSTWLCPMGHGHGSINVSALHTTLIANLQRFARQQAAKVGELEAENERLRAAVANFVQHRRESAARAACVYLQRGEPCDCGEVDSFINAVLPKGKP